MIAIFYPIKYFSMKFNNHARFAVKFCPSTKTKKIQTNWKY